MDDPRPDEWRSVAPCRGEGERRLPNGQLAFDFFDESRDNVEFLRRRFCGRCPVAHRCLMEAISHPTNYGVWGGLTTPQRRRYARELRRRANRARNRAS